MANLTDTYLDIVNSALLMLGEDTISAFEVDPDVSSPSNTIQKIVVWQLQQTADMVLSQFPWSTASAWKAFGSGDEATVPTQDVYDNAYTVPSDYIRLIRLYDSDGNPWMPEDEEWLYTFQGTLLLTNESSPEMLYVKRALIDESEDPASDWSNLLTDYMATFFAYKIAYPITNDSRLKQQLFQEVQFKFTEVTMSDAVSHPRQDLNRGVLERARYMSLDAM